MSHEKYFQRIKLHGGNKMGYCFQIQWLTLHSAGLHLIAPFSFHLIVTFLTVHGEINTVTMH